MSASVSETITVNSSAATGVVLQPLVDFSTLVNAGPVAAGSALYNILVSPSTWSGSLVLSGPNASLFAINSSNQLAVGSSPLPAGTYNVTITASP